MFEKTLFLFQARQTHASYNSDPGHRYRLRVIQVNRLTQVFNSQRTGSAEQNSNATMQVNWTCNNSEYNKYNVRHEQARDATS